MNVIGNNLQAVNTRIAQAAKMHGRDAGDIKLIAVSKTFDAAAIHAAYAAGQRAFGENYVQEALGKMTALRQQYGDLPDIEWHFIGPLQSNKTKQIAEHFDWVHSVDRLKIAERLSAARPPTRKPLQICLQVHLGGEASKSGAEPADVPALAQQVRALPQLALRGLMTIPPPSDDIAQQRMWFARLRALRDTLQNAGVLELSMGMSRDLEAAIAEGATLVRVGTAIFGKRQKIAG